MSGNGDGVAVIRLDWAQLTGGLRGDATPCDHCGGHLPDHAWADVDRDDPDRPVVNCSGERE